MGLNTNSKKRSGLVYLGGFLLATHYATVAYVNSSLLKQFASDSAISLLYVAGSIASVILLTLAPAFLRKAGNVVTLLVFIVLESFAVFGMGNFSIVFLIMFLFILHQAAESMLYFSLDVSLEHEIKIEGATGRKRGIFLTAQNIAWVLSPLALSFLAFQDDFKNVYYLSAAALVPLFFIAMLFFRHTKNTTVATSHIISALSSLRRSFDEARIMGAQFILQFYFSWMVIYLPLLLSREIGFGWDKIGFIFTIMLIPYLIFEFPAGLWGDKKIGEKELLIAGFIIMFLTTLIIPLIKTPTFLIWSAVLFATRIGASLVEESSESYFFKHIKEEDTGLISLFRMARPLSFIIAPIIAIPVIYFFSYSASFYFLAFFSLLGLFFIPKVDTR